MKYLYDDSGEYQGCTKTPDDFPSLNKTDSAPPEYNEFTQKVVYVDGAWEIRDVN